MTMDPATSEYRCDHAVRTYYFCSSGCKGRFDREPYKYVAVGKGAA